MTTKIDLGKSGLSVTPIGLGTNAVGGHNIYDNLSDDTGKEIVRVALDAGYDFLDTAYFYGPAYSEQLIGEVVKETGKRKDVILATKGAHQMTGGEIEINNSPEFLKEAVNQSLQRLQTDYLDLFYIHFPDEKTPKDEAVGALKELKDDGKIKAIGVSNFSIEQLKEANKDGYVDIFQGEYNLFKREAEDVLFPYLQEHNIAFVPYFPLASGLLTGKYTKESHVDEWRKRNPLFKGETFFRNLEKIEVMKTIAEKKQVDTAHVVLAWYLQHDAIDIVIPGAKSPEQVQKNLKTLQVELSKQEWQHIDQVFSQ